MKYKFRLPIFGYDKGDVLLADQDGNVEIRIVEGIGKDRDLLTTSFIVYANAYPDFFEPINEEDEEDEKDQEAIKRLESRGYLVEKNIKFIKVDAKTFENMDFKVNVDSYDVIFYKSYPYSNPNYPIYL